ncbi:DUF1573 domain-containing protein [Flammeovirgaceae bacterium SG7u.111]|nr:DUF1573 domain-containing protein [Flammeovirgaceae bacterium SG7u.132]WPO34706.1 DUF1573 domain-containing protein [Flammeovirgaceae bacterium SG7u.111]
MKKVILPLLMLFFAAASYAQQAQVIGTEAATFSWKAQEVNLGKIKKGVPAEAVFTFTNEGKAPLIITEVKPTCGCTIASWPKEPLQKGETASIKATYNAANKGVFHKSIRVYSNSTTPVAVLVIKGEVVETTVGR